MVAGPPSSAACLKTAFGSLKPTAGAPLGMYDTLAARAALQCSNPTAAASV